jgi:pimeloyl-ACP methyl ester carboxylesterase
MPPINRGFVNVSHGQMHYREAGVHNGGTPILTLHASPGSSQQLQKLVGALAEDLHVIAPDTPGNGDSEPLSSEEPTIVQLAEAMQHFLDAKGIGQVDVYGSHTGASIAVELAILVPDRVRTLALDGLSTFEGEELAEILERYAHPFEPDIDGAYLLRIFQFCRDQYMFFPWYRKTVEGHRVNGLPAAVDLHAWVLEVMKAHDSYHLNYRAAFKWNGFERMPLVTQPVLLFAGENDPLIDQTEALSKVTADVRFHALPRLDDPAFAERRHRLMRALIEEAANRKGPQ